MSIIHVLDQQTANSIAAGEVVERPASVVKELVENSLDAKASVITIEIRQGGIRLIKVTDNGVGMSPVDALLAFDRHATSKISKIEDLDEIATMGFRGEALASIAAVADVRLETREPDAAEGFTVNIKNGTLIDKSITGCPVGTSISIEHLFANVPARYKFLRKDATEAGAIADVATRLALARPDISFRLINNGQEVIHTPGNNDLLSTLYAIYGKNTAKDCLEVDWQEEPVKVSGFTGRPELSRSSRSQQSFFVNGRLVKSKTLTAALDEGYKTLMMKGKHAFTVLFIELPPHLLDVNVHPQKLEVRFWNDQSVFRAVVHALRQSLSGGAAILDTGNREEETKDDKYNKIDDNNQQAGNNSYSANARGLYISERLPEQAELNLEPVRNIANNDADFEMNTSKPDGIQSTASAMPEARKIDIISRSRYVGQLFSTYILLEYGEEILLIDQHAAHEKIIFEEMVSKHNARQENVIHQDLLIPLRIELSPEEIQFAVAEKEILDKLGFTFDILGSKEIILRSLPAAEFSQLDPEKAFRSALDKLVHEDERDESAIREIYYDIACKAAVKAHDRLKEEEVASLLSELQKLENPYQCPHGRPVIISIGKRELEKKFKRIV